MKANNHKSPFSQIQFGSRLRHEELPPPLLARLRACWEIVRPYDSTPAFEVYEKNFLCDAHPEREIRIAEAIAASLQEYLMKWPKANGKYIYGLATAITCGHHDSSAPAKRLARLLKKHYGCPIPLPTVEGPNGEIENLSL